MENERQKLTDAATNARKLIDVAAEKAVGLIKEAKDETNQNLAIVMTRIEDIKNDIKEIKETLKQDYVTRAEFGPVKTLVFGLVGLLLTGVVGALLTLVLKK